MIDYKAYENEMIDDAIDALRNTAGIDIEVKKLNTHGFGDKADAFIKMKIYKNTYEFVVEVKRVDRFATVAHVKHQLEQFTERPLLITQRLTGLAAEKCKELDLNFIDLAGNAYINEPGLYLLIKGQKQDLIRYDRQNYYFKGGKALTPTNLKMVFVLLCNPELLNAPYREIAKVAGIALGAVGWGFTDLAERGLTLGGNTKGNRILIQPEKLIHEWVTNYPIKLRPKLNQQKFRTKNTDWWKNLDVKQYHAQWGGEVAAQKITNYLKPNLFTLYLYGEDKKKNKMQLIVENKLIPDIGGDIEILDAFWDFKDEQFLPELVPTLLIYTDLIATNDPRNLEIAKMIYDKINKHVDH